MQFPSLCSRLRSANSTGELCSGSSNGNSNSRPSSSTAQELQEQIYLYARTNLVILSISASQDDDSSKFVTVVDVETSYFDYATRVFAKTNE